MKTVLVYRGKFTCPKTRCVSFQLPHTLLCGRWGLEPQPLTHFGRSVIVNVLPFILCSLCPIHGHIPDGIRTHVALPTWPYALPLSYGYILCQDVESNHGYRLFRPALYQLSYLDKMWTRRESNPQFRFAKPVCSR